jgi:predicted kinase
MQPGVLVISGIPGTGKTTVSALVARRLGRSAHIEAELIDWQMALLPTQEAASDERTSTAPRETTGSSSSTGPTTRPCGTTTLPDAT